MTDSGLNQRLRQRSRRSGLMIGFSMLLTLMVCVGAFTMIYARLEPVVADFVGRGEIEAPTVIPTQEPVAQAPEPTAVPDQPEDDDTVDEEQNDETDTEGGDNQIEQSNTDSDSFEPDYQVDAGGPVNLRPGPGVGSGNAIIALPVATPLIYLGEQEATDDPDRDQMDSGQVWMKFRTEDGAEGWMRELDVTEYEP